MPYTRKSRDAVKREGEKDKLVTGNSGYYVIMRLNTCNCTGTMDSSSSTGFETVPQVSAQASYVPNATSSGAEKKIDTVSGPADPEVSQRAQNPKPHL